MILLCCSLWNCCGISLQPPGELLKGAHFSTFMPLRWDVVLLGRKNFVNKDCGGIVRDFTKHQRSPATSKGRPCRKLAQETLHKSWGGAGRPSFFGKLP